MSEVGPLISALGQAADRGAVERIEDLIEQGSDRDLNRINPLAFGQKHGLDEEKTIAAFLHGARLGLFDMSRNVLCPGCGGVIDSNATLKAVDRDEYHCTLCAAGYEPTLDEMIEVTFTVSPRVRHIAAHDPNSLSAIEYYRQVFWGSGVDLPDNLEEAVESATLDVIELGPGERAFLSVELPLGIIIIRDPVTHATQRILIEGEPTSERQSLTTVIAKGHTQSEPVNMRPGPLRLSIENHADERVLPSLWIVGSALKAILGRRRPFLTAKRLLSNQTFRDIYRADTLDVNQRLKITSLTFLFTDLKGSTELYERVGDLAAFDLVRAHFRVLQEIVAAEAGAVVKTIGDAVMATFPTPDRALAAALRMREAMRDLNEQRGREDLLLKIGLHEGPCLAVTLNDRQDYFGQTVNIASRVQNLANTDAIFATESVVKDHRASGVLSASGIASEAKSTALRGIENEVAVYALQ